MLLAREALASQSLFMDRTPILAVDGEIGTFILDENGNEVFRLSDEARRLLALVDGARTVREVAEHFTPGGVTDALPSCAAFFDRCVEAGLVTWKEDVRQPVVARRPRAKLG